jgi:hypothetical protein
MSKRSERLLSALSDIDSQYILEAGEETPQKTGKQRHWKRWTALAAALALAVGIGVGSQTLFRMGGSSSGGGGSGCDGATTFMSYAGPVFPLTLEEENANITAQREITLDFAPWVKTWVTNEEQIRQDDPEVTEEELQERLADFNEWYPEGGVYRSSDKILVTDGYTLTNQSGEDQTVTALYPFVGSLRDLDQRLPTLSLDGVELETKLHTGSYSGGFQGTEGDPDSSLNLEQLTSWEQYKALLSDGSYLTRALGEYPDLTGIPVTVYEFTDPWGPEADDDGGLPNPTIRADYTMDYHKTTVLSYGFHGLKRDVENNFQSQQFSIREPKDRGYGVPCYLIVIGDDIQDLTTQGYNTGGFDTTTTIEAGVTVTRYESDLDTMLRQVAALLYQDFSENEPSESVDFELYYGALCDYLTTVGPLAEDGAERYNTGWLWDTDFDAVNRVFYLEAELTIPAGESVTLCAQFRMNSSFDFYCAGTENRGICGYDLVTELGSNLNCTEQTATLLDRGQIEIVRQNFGFDLENGVTTVTLDPEEEHYYLEVRGLTGE